jgi:hypothetical protein
MFWIEVAGGVCAGVFGSDRALLLRLVSMDI